MKNRTKRDYRVTLRHPDKQVQEVVVQAVSQFDAMQQVQSQYPNSKMVSVKSSAW